MNSCAICKLVGPGIQSTPFVWFESSLNVKVPCQHSFSLSISITIKRCDMLASTVYFKHCQTFYAVMCWTCCDRFCLETPVCQKWWRMCRSSECYGIVVFMYLLCCIRYHVSQLIFWQNPCESSLSKSLLDVLAEQRCWIYECFRPHMHTPAHTVAHKLRLQLIIIQ